MRIENLLIERVDPMGLKVGVARGDITPELPIDLVGYSRRAEHVNKVRRPLLATVLVLDDASNRIAIVSMDILALDHKSSIIFRELIASEIGCKADEVMLNFSHTHAGPQAVIDSIKIGGTQTVLSKNEISFIESLPGKVAKIANEAVRNMTDAATASSVGSVNLTVNRRERSPEGRTILGWNKDGVCDQEVGVIRVDTLEGSNLAVIVNFACHPVVVGPEDQAVNSDFVGPMRDFVESYFGGICLFLQGAAGNILPIEGFFDHEGPEVIFGKRLAAEVINISADLQPVAMEIEKVNYGSVTPISLYRKIPEEDRNSQGVSSSSMTVELPLKKLPTKSEITAEKELYVEAFNSAKNDGAFPEELNPLEYHINWADYALELLNNGWDSHHVPAFLQVFRIHDTAIVGIPGELFSEIGIKIKSSSPSKITLIGGYTNGVISYLPTAEEYKFGGYECDYAHHSWGLVEQVAPEIEGILKEASATLLEEVWNR